MKLFLMSFGVIFFNFMGSCSAVLLPHEEHQIKRVEAYFNHLKTLKATFTQINPNGRISEGRFYISRPGKMRIEYMSPDSKLIIADGEWLIYHDADHDETTHVPLENSPAYIILQEHVSFQKGVHVIKFSEEQNMLRLTLVRKDDPETGSLTLVLQKEPLQLKEWVILDAQGLETMVRLESLKEGGALDAQLFLFERFRF